MRNMGFTDQEACIQAWQTSSLTVLLCCFGGIDTVGLYRGYIGSYRGFVGFLDHSVDGWVSLFVRGLLCFFKYALLVVQLVV